VTPSFNLFSSKGRKKKKDEEKEKERERESEKWEYNHENRKMGEKPKKNAITKYRAIVFLLPSLFFLCHCCIEAIRHVHPIA